MKDARRLILLAGCVLIAIPSLLLAVTQLSTRPTFPHENALPPVAGPTSLPVHAGLEELSGFETHLPILVLELASDPEIHAQWDNEKGYAVRTIDDPFVEGRFILYHNGDTPNRLTDEPALDTRIRSRLRGNSSLRFAKHQYLVRMLDEDGAEREHDVLGMGKDDEWIVNISYIDKSLIRNYLCLNIAAWAMGYAPETRYCEVFQKRGDDYEYLGLYLIMESIKRGKSRINLSRYNPQYAECAYLLRRDRYSERGVILDTYGSIHKLTMGSLEVRYPGKSQITDKTIGFIEKDISLFEQALYSDNVEQFIACRNLIDFPSFVDYFVLNEFFGNYDAGFVSYYMSKDLRGKLKLGPLWDFDQALDNNAPHHFEPEACAMQVGVWFNRLIRDAFFSRQILSRYASLRKSFLSDRSIDAAIDNIVAYLGDARLRDWNRWQYNNIEELQRARIEYVHPSLMSNSRSFEEEIAHIKSIMHAHGAWLDTYLGDVVMGDIVTE